MSWLDKIIPSVGTIRSNDRKEIQDGQWTTCPKCQVSLFIPQLPKELFVCTKCSNHLRLDARNRLALFFDTDTTYTEIGSDIKPRDILKFKDTEKYKDRLTRANLKTGETEAILIARGVLNGRICVVGAFEFNFLGGSMSAAVGQRFIAGVEYCISHGLPLICFSTSGGARMQESMFSLLQMARTAAALERLKRQKLPFISVLVDPVYGGVSASLAMLGDIIIAEPDALIGFTGPRVIEQTVRVRLPKGFQRSEFLLAHGAIDLIVQRKNIRSVISNLLDKLLYKT